MKEQRHQREAAARRPHLVMKKAFEPPKTTDSGHGGQSLVGVVKVGRPWFC